jgi:prepilin signal peptidase PulO-like enzyme (type II secretory pathway)
MIAIILGALFFACIAFLAEQLSRIVCANITRLPDGPPSSNPPVIFLIAAAAFLGAVLVHQGTDLEQIAIAAIAVLALVACWCTDSLCGIVPDVFTLGPLALILVIAVVQRDWWVLISAIALFIPFAVAASFSRGMGMGWGDAKLVALAGAILGAPLALVAMAIACVAAVIGYRIKRIKSGPIAFAPYIAATIGLAMPLGLVR